MDANEKLIKSYDALLLVEIHDLTDDEKQQYSDTLHRLSNDMTALDASKLKSINDLVNQEYAKVNAAVERLTIAAENNESVVIAFNIISESLQVVENLLSITF